MNATAFSITFSANTAPSRAAMISNHVGFRARAAVREVAKVYGLPEQEIKAVTQRMGYYWSIHNLEDSIQHHPVYKDMELKDPWPEIIRLAVKLDGYPRHMSVHCGGIVIVPDRIDRYVPVEPAPKGVPIIQWEKDQAEDAGLIKIDLLGNRSLAVIRDALAAIKENYGIEIDYEQWDPTTDAKTQDLIRRGDTVGVFYVESPVDAAAAAEVPDGRFRSSGDPQLDHTSCGQQVYSRICAAPARRFLPVAASYPG